MLDRMDQKNSRHPAEGLHDAGCRDRQADRAVHDALLAAHPEARGERRDPAARGAARRQEGQCRGDGVRLHHHEPSHPGLARQVPRGLEGLSRGGRVLPHERAGRLSPARGRSRHRALRQLLQEADRPDRAVRCELGLRHGADQIYDVAAARIRGGAGGYGLRSSSAIRLDVSHRLPPMACTSA